ncbi:MAG: hypothetical protein QOF78_2557 [Phycisphaerales bacterium]|jgi:putative heme-binding domain-containing protein|nr:hypothetical protein [Phycisphaerales bacterium]
MKHLVALSAIVASGERPPRLSGEASRQCGFIRIALLLLLLLNVQLSAAVEKWADPALPVKDGVSIWLDATRQTAAWAANQREIAGGDLLDVFYDASGNGRNFSQPMRDAQPKLIVADQQAAVRFDGKDDHLRGFERGAGIDRGTIFIVASARSNAGGFRAFLAGNETGRNDYVTGFTIDMGPFPSDGMKGIGFLNVEGKGFTAARNLLESAAPFEDFHVFTIAIDANEVSAQANGAGGGKRERTAPKLSAENLILAARCCSNEGTPPYIQGFLDGDVAEVIVYDRVLSVDQRKAVEKYLSAKYERAGDALARAVTGGEPLKMVEKPPAVQMFVPGFTYKKLPLDLTNINNLRYREDGKLVALAYDGNVYLLSDTNGDGLEDQAKLYWDNSTANGGKIEQPIGMALTPEKFSAVHGRGVFVANKGKLSLLLDTDGDDKADKEQVVATGWPLSFHQVDALGVAVDPKDQAIYFGVGTTNFADPFLFDKQGVSHYDRKGERGTILRVAPDLKSREIVCTGIRFSVGLAFNRAGDLFATDQEGATWVPNGNPFDELLHIQPGRHYGFPPRHPKHITGVIDEPSTFDYAPQHQSTCGLLFNDGVNGGPVFGPESWRGDAIVCGSSRGKLYRTKLAKTPAGYVARSEVIGSIPMLLIDACVSPAGDLVVACHSGAPDWGSGPTGKGTLYKISYQDKAAPQPVAAWQASPSEMRIAFDRAIEDAPLQRLSKAVAIDAGEFVGAGDRFEVMRPGYDMVVRQTRAPRRRIPVGGVQISSDRRTLILNTPPQRQAMGFGVTLDDVDLAHDMNGVAAEWKSADGARTWSGWLPHPDLAVSRAFTSGSAEHDALWQLLKKPGQLTLKTSLDLRNMLRAAVQPGAKLDFTLPPEEVTITFSSGAPPMKVTAKDGELVPLELSLTTGQGEPSLNLAFITQEDSTPRPLALKRFVMPWAKLKAESTAAREAIAELKGGDWLRGRKIFFGIEAGCGKCHQVRGQGSDLGPDLSNLIHRDYESVVRDIRQPSGALNPDYIASSVKLNDGRVLHGIVRNRGEDFLVRGDAEGEKGQLRRSSIKTMKASPISVMPSGILEGIGPEKTRDLLTFLLTVPVEPAVIERKGAPPPRPRSEFDAVMKAATTAPATSSLKELHVLLVSSAKDHGPSEHDYPAWQKRWSTLLALADNVKVDTANDWPTQAQLQSADVAVFYSANPAWNEQRGKEFDAYLSRGGGAVFLHMAVHGQKHPQALADCIGLAWGPGAKFRHGAVELNFRDVKHPITRGFGPSGTFIDESYWNLTGDAARIHLLADALEEQQPRPLLWTQEKGKGRVFVSILGHYTWTFDDPLFRLLVLRGICWSAQEDPDRLSNLATIGARIVP